MKRQPAPMISKKHFNGIAHNIAHYAQSGLSDMNPHVGAAIRSNGPSHARLDLLAEAPWPHEFVAERPLQLVSAALQAKFRGMVLQAGLDMDDLAAASLSFISISWKGD